MIWETKPDADAAAALGEAIRARLAQHLGLCAVETAAAVTEAEDGPGTPVVAAAGAPPVTT
ncbi:hypothetical protein [Streptomyces sp. NPDC046939]|uniref:hypothetical protein n=1 Tax=Streptomyces sp. NPDC046939 TaxID=3155376 RepID=UPI0033C97254